MKTNITTDNYEAYLLDYMEGNLSPDETEPLKAFVATQGLDWDELTAPLPYLEAPQIAYEGQEDSKKSRHRAALCQDCLGCRCRRTAAHRVAVARQVDARIEAAGRTETDSSATAHHRKRNHKLAATNDTIRSATNCQKSQTCSFQNRFRNLT